MGLILLPVLSSPLYISFSSSSSSFLLLHLCPSFVSGEASSRYEGLPSPRPRRGGRGHCFRSPSAPAPTVELDRWTDGADEQRAGQGTCCHERLAGVGVPGDSVWTSADRELEVRGSRLVYGECFVEREFLREHSSLP